MRKIRKHFAPLGNLKKVAIWHPDVKSRNESKALKLPRWLSTDWSPSYARTLGHRTVASNWAWLEMKVSSTIEYSLAASWNTASSIKGCDKSLCQPVRDANRNSFTLRQKPLCLCMFQPISTSRLTRGLCEVFAAKRCTKSSVVKCILACSHTEKQLVPAPTAASRYGLRYRLGKHWTWLLPL